MDCQKQLAVARVAEVEKARSNGASAQLSCRPTTSCREAAADSTAKQADSVRAGSGSRIGFRV